MGVPEIVIYSKPDCCLCDRAKEQLMRLQERHQFTLREVNILDDPEAHEKFKDDIPVIFINGEKAFKYRLDEKQVVRMLQTAHQSQKTQGAH